MKRTEKEEQVAQLKEKFTGSAIAILADYKGLNVEAITQLRNSLRKSSVEFKVFKNTLAKIAAEATGHGGLGKFMEGPTAYAFSKDVVAPAKVIRDFQRDHPQLQLKGALLEGSVVASADILKLADLPSRPVLLSILAGGLQAPMRNLGSALQGVLRKFAYGLNSLKEKKEAAQPAEPAPAEQPAAS